MAMDADINGLKPIESGGLDFSEYEGLKKKVEELEILEVPSKYAKSGKTKVLKVITEPVTLVKTKEGKEIEIRATEIFNLKLDDKTGTWGYSTSPKSKLQKLMIKLKVNKLSDLKNKMVVIKVREVRREDGTTGEFLGFHIE